MFDTSVRKTAGHAWGRRLNGDGLAGDGVKTGARINDAHGRAKKDEQGSEEIHGDFFDERKEESIDRREGGRARALRWRVQPGASVSGK